MLEEQFPAENWTRYDPSTENPLQDMIDRNRQRQRDCAELEDQITELAGQLNAMNYAFLKLLAAFDDKAGWQGEGIKSFAHWLNWKCGIGALAAREKVRVARALPALPLIDAAFRQGEVSYSKVRAMTRVATPANESLLLEIARHGTAQHVEQTVRKYRRCQQIEARNNEDQPAAALSSWQDEAGMVHLHVTLPADEGELVLQAVESMLQQVRADREAATENVSAETNVSAREDVSAPANVSAETFSFPGNRAFSLVRIAEHYLADTEDSKTRTGSDRYQVVLHVNANEQHRDHLIVGGPCCHLDQNRFLAPQVARQLACDASITVMTEDDAGNVLNIGRRSRRISRAMRLALDARDGGCRFPNCHQSTWTDAHHIHHWADGGETSLDNLITLCRHHHRLLHQGDYEIHRQGEDVVFTKPDGRATIERAKYPQFEPAEPDAVLGEIKLDLAARGIDIDANTAVTRWCGERCDYDQAIEGLFSLEIKQIV